MPRGIKETLLIIVEKNEASMINNFNSHGHDYFINVPSRLASVQVLANKNKL